MKTYWEMIKEDQEALELVAEIKDYYRRHADADRAEFLQRQEGHK